VKLFLREAESAALVRAVGDRIVATSAISSVEIVRAIRVASASDDVECDLDDVLGGCTIVGVEEDVVRSATALAGPGLRALDAVHLASALHVGARAMVVYDRQLARAARSAGLSAESPGVA